MNEADPEFLSAYYCFVNFGWPPSEYLKLSYRERILIFEFIMRDLKTRDKINKDVNVNGKNS